MLAKEAAEATPAGGTGGASKRRKCSSASGRAGAARFGSSDAAGDALAPGHRDGSPGDEAFVDLHAESSESGASSSAGCQRLDPRLQGPAAHAASPAVDLSQLFQTTTSTAAREACPGFPGTAKTPQELCNAFAIPIAGLPQISLPNHAVLDAWMSRSYANFLSQKIENACIQYALRSRSCKVERGAAVEQMIEKSMVERLAEIAVHMMFDDVGLGRFINMLEVCHLPCSVFRQILTAGRVRGSSSSRSSHAASCLAARSLRIFPTNSTPNALRGPPARARSWST